MPSISQAVSHLPELQHLFQRPSFTANTNQFQARSQTLTNTNLSVVTAEGDRVSLSAGSEVKTSIGTYTFQGFVDGQAASLQTQQFSTSTQKNFHLLVEGDLNEQEQADIQEFLQSAQKILQELTTGNIQDATTTVASLGKLDTLSQAALFVRQSTSVSVATQSTRLAVQEDPGRTESSKGRSSFKSEPTSSLEQILQKLREAQEQSQLDPETLVSRLPKLATTLLQSLKDESDSTDSSPSILKQIQKVFLDSLLESTDNFQVEQDIDSPLTNQANSTNPAFSIREQEKLNSRLLQPKIIADQTNPPGIQPT